MVRSVSGAPSLSEVMSVAEAGPNAELLLRAAAPFVADAGVASGPRPGGKAAVEAVVSVFARYRLGEQPDLVAISI